VVVSGRLAQNKIFGAGIASKPQRGEAASFKAKRVRAICARPPNQEITAVTGLHMPLVFFLTYVLHRNHSTPQGCDHNFLREFLVLKLITASIMARDTSTS